MVGKNRKKRRGKWFWHQRQIWLHASSFNHKRREKSQFRHSCFRYDVFHPPPPPPPPICSVTVAVDIQYTNSQKFLSFNSPPWTRLLIYYQTQKDFFTFSAVYPPFQNGNFGNFKPWKWLQTLTWRMGIVIMVKLSYFLAKIFQKIYLRNFVKNDQEIMPKIIRLNAKTPYAIITNVA